jgi:predicted phage tail protein
MSLLKLVPAWLHGIGDYGAGIALLIVPLLVGGSDEAVYTGVVLGAVLLVVSLFTRYPLGAVKAVPFPVHSAGDYLGGILAILAPFVLGFSDSHTGLSVFYIVVGAVVIALSLVTNYQDPRIDASEARSHRVSGRSDRGVDRTVSKPRTSTGAPRRVT